MLHLSFLPLVHDSSLLYALSAGGHLIIPSSPIPIPYFECVLSTNQLHLNQTQILRNGRIRYLGSIENQIERTFLINLRAMGWKLVLFALYVSWASLLSTLFTSLKMGRQNFMRPLSGLMIQLAATGAKSKAAGLERANSYQRSPISALFVVVKPYMSDMWWM